MKQNQLGSSIQGRAIHTANLVIRPWNSRNHRRLGHYRLHGHQNLAATEEVNPFRTYGKMDDPIGQDGDSSFRAINTYVEPTSLQEGFVTESINMRLNGDKATVREGLSWKAGTVSPTYSAGPKRCLRPLPFNPPPPPSDSVE